MNELNGLTRDDNRPSLITTRSVTERLPNGRTTEKRVLQMEPEVAELVRAAEQAELPRRYTHWVNPAHDCAPPQGPIREAANLQ